MLRINEIKTVMNKGKIIMIIGVFVIALSGCVNVNSYESKEVNDKKSSESCKGDICAKESGRLGVAIGESYEGEDFEGALEGLGVNQTHINIWWDDIQPKGEFNFNVLDSFLEELSPQTSAIFRISARYNSWGTKDSSTTVPKDLSEKGTFYNYVYNVVKRTDGRITYFESEWEADCVKKHWTGTAEEYAQMSSIFYAAVKDANPKAKIIMGGSVGKAGGCTESFFAEVFKELKGERIFDFFDIHLYENLYDIPERVSWTREFLNSYGYKSVGLIVTEYGGPSPNEYAAKYPKELVAIKKKAESDLCYFSTDGGGNPDEIRMFFYGVESELDEKRDRIQGKQITQRTILALSEGVEKLFWWNIKAPVMNANCPNGSFFRHPIFGKMQLTEKQKDGSLKPRSTYEYYENMAKYLNDATSVNRLSVDDMDKHYLFEVFKKGGEKTYVIWEKRDQFYGEDDAATLFKFKSKLKNVKAEDVFGESIDINVTEKGDTSLLIKDVPIFIEEL